MLNVYISCRGNFKTKLFRFSSASHRDQRRTMQQVSKGLADLKVEQTVTDPQGNPGTKNRAVTKPVSLNAATGEVMVKKSTGKSKIRKGQPEKEYQRQLEHYIGVEKGPLHTPEGWMAKNEALREVVEGPELDLTLKQDRQQLVSRCHLLYYERQYAECAAYCEKLLSRFEVLTDAKRTQKEKDELRYILKQCQSKLSQ
ncbi:LAMI_0E08372g1_1 [Lachancea mirantina]|uniref:LAMI_0E08372g1_1 n=1 Tax=Lachancea mirantina TaxID=1230905 RepID=A0A1G4JMY8_9SACH|nr:LAMI_0E08372g1_1 [Lachancea mirantina]